MPPSSKSKQRGRAPSAELETDAKETEGPTPINLGDSVALKRALDDAVVETLQNEGWTLDYSLVDLKLAVGLAACVVACVGQFYPKRLPTTPLVLAVCVASYALLSAALTAIGALLERDAIALTRGGPGAGAPPRLALASRLPRFQDTYTLRIWPRQGGLLSVSGSSSGGGGGGLLSLLRGGGGGLPPQPGELQLSKSVAAYFTADGFLDHEAIVGDARRLLRQLAAAGGESAKDK